MPQPHSNLTSPINPDGVPIFLNWNNLVVGTSVFIPALNMRLLKRQMTKEAAWRQVHVVGMERIEGGKLGMRFWRVL